MLACGILAGFAMTINLAQAATSATIRDVTAEIHEGPDEGTPVLEIRKAKEKVKVSDRDKEGWHKIKLKREREGFKYGWIRAESLKFSGSSHSESGDSSPYNPDHVEYSIMAAYDVPTSGAVIEAGYQASRDFRVSVRGGVKQYLQEASSTAINYDVEGREIFALGEYRFAESGPMSFGVAGGLGVSLSTTMTEKATTTLAKSASFTAMGGMAKVTGRYFFTKNIALHAEAGIRYFSKSNIEVGANVVNLALTSVVGAAGIAFEF